MKCDGRDPARRHGWLRALCACVLFLAAPAALAAQSGVIRGRVVEQATRAGVFGVTVTLEGGAHTAATDDAGRFAFPRVDAGSYTIRFEVPGFAPRNETVTLQAGDTVEIEISLSRQPIELPPMSVTVRTGAITSWLATRGFATRGLAGRARLHMSHSELRHQGARNLRELLRRTPGVRLRPLADGGGELLLDPSPRPDGAPCRVSVYLNGSNVEFGRFDWTGVNWNQRASRPFRWDDLLALEQIDGIELYGPDDRPTAAADGCGALLLWSAELRPVVDEAFTGELTGTAIAAATGAPLRGVRITLLPLDARAETDTVGRFRFAEIPAGEYEVFAEYPGTEPWRAKVEVKAYGVIEIELRIGS